MSNEWKKIPLHSSCTVWVTNVETEVNNISWRRISWFSYIVLLSRISSFCFVSFGYSMLLCPFSWLTLYVKCGNEEKDCQRSPSDRVDVSPSLWCRRWKHSEWVNRPCASVWGSSAASSTPHSKIRVSWFTHLYSFATSLENKLSCYTCYWTVQTSDFNNSSSKTVQPRIRVWTKPSSNQSDTMQTKPFLATLSGIKVILTLTLLILNPQKRHHCLNFHFLKK